MHYRAPGFAGTEPVETRPPEGSHLFRASRIGAGGQAKSFQQRACTAASPRQMPISQREHTERSSVTLAAEQPRTPEHDQESGVRVHTVLAAE